MERFRIRKRAASFKKITSRKLTYLAIAAAAVVLIIIGVNQYVFNYPDTPENIALSSIDANEMVAANIQRSDDQVSYTIEIEMNRAIADAYILEYQRAKERLALLLEAQINELQRVMIELNLGIISYNLHDFDTAERHFLNVIQSQNWANEEYLEQTWWYLANNNLKKGRVSGAREAAFNAAGFGGRYQMKSEELLRRSEKLITKSE